MADNLYFEMEIAKLQSKLADLQDLLGGEEADGLGSMPIYGGGGLDLSKVALGYTASGTTWTVLAGEIDRVAVVQAAVTVANDNFVYVRRTLSNNTMLVAAAASVPANTTTYAYYRLYQVTVTAGVASLKFALHPFDVETIGGFTGTVTVVTDVVWSSPTLSKKTKLHTYLNGVLVSVGDEATVTVATALTGCPA